MTTKKRRDTSTPLLDLLMGEAADLFRPPIPMNPQPLVENREKVIKTVVDSVALGNIKSQQAYMIICSKGGEEKMHFGTEGRFLKEMLKDLGKKYETVHYTTAEYYKIYGNGGLKNESPF